MEVRRIEVSRIVEDPDNPRKAIDDASLVGLADSIKQHGILNPITVVPLAGVDGYRIVTGERRWRAAQIAGLFDIPCIVREDADVDPADKTTEQLIENLQREELMPLDKASAIQTIKNRIGATNREIAQRLGLSERSVGYLLDLLDLPEEIGEQIVSSPNRPADGNLTEKHGRFLRALNDEPELQKELVEKIREEKLSSDDTGKVARALKQNPDKSEEILNSRVEDIPGVIGREVAGGSGFSAGKAFAGIAEGMVPTIGEIKLSSISADDLPTVEQALIKLKAALDSLLAEIRAINKATRTQDA